MQSITVAPPPAPPPPPGPPPLPTMPVVRPPSPSKLSLAAPSESLSTIAHLSGELGGIAARLGAVSGERFPWSHSVMRGPCSDEEAAHRVEVLVGFVEQCAQRLDSTRRGSVRGSIRGSIAPAQPAMAPGLLTRRGTSQMLPHAGMLITSVRKEMKTELVALPPPAPAEEPYSPSNQSAIARSEQEMRV